MDYLKGFQSMLITDRQMLKQPGKVSYRDQSGSDNVMPYKRLLSCCDQRCRRLRFCLSRGRVLSCIDCSCRSQIPSEHAWSRQQRHWLKRTRQGGQARKHFTRFTHEAVQDDHMHAAGPGRHPEQGTSITAMASVCERHSLLKVAAS